MFKRQVEREAQEADNGSGESDESYSSSSSSDSEMETTSTGAPSKNTNKLMVLASRGINARQRHLMDDLSRLLSHSKKESKFDSKHDLFALNELAELNGCTHCLYFEARKPQELFLWMAKCPGGPSARFHVQNIHTLDELGFAGNCQLGTRAILTFDGAFEASEQGRTMRGLFEQVFGVPEGHRKTKPYIDHVFHFAMADDRIWFRCYEIVPAGSSATSTLEIDGFSLVEIGPRMVLHPIRVFSGSFGGHTIWQNPNYRSAAEIRASLKRDDAAKHLQRNIAIKASSQRKQQANLSEDELDNVFDEIE